MDVERVLEQGRGACAGGDWQVAFDALGRAAREQELAPEDLELFARSAYMLGLDDEYRGALERAFHAYRDAGDARRAVRGGSATTSCSSGSPPPQVGGSLADGGCSSTKIGTASSTAIS